MKHTDFLETTGRIFSDIDDLIINFLNEIEKEDRDPLYHKLTHMTDDTVDNYHTLIKLILEATDTQLEAESLEEALFLQVTEVKRLITQYQESLSNVLLLIIEMSKQLNENELFEDSAQTARQMQSYIV